MSKALTALLVVAILAGVLFFVIQRNRLANITPDYERLSALVGALNVKDPGNYLVTRVEQDSKRRFFWRLFVPESIRSPELHRFGLSEVSRSPIIQPGESSLLINVRIIDGRVQLYARTEQSSSIHKMHQDLDPFLVEHWDDLEFDLLGDADPSEIEPAEVLQLIRVRVPERLVKHLPDDVSEYDRRKLEEGVPLFECRIGSQAALRALKEDSQ